MTSGKSNLGPWDARGQDNTAARVFSVCLGPASPAGAGLILLRAATPAVWSALGLRTQCGR